MKAVIMTSLVAWQRGIGVRTVRQRVPISLQAVTFVPSVDCQGGGLMAGLSDKTGCGSVVRTETR